MAAARFAKGTIVGGRFEIERLAGVGGMGEVYRARDPQTGEAVAVKFVHHTSESLLARFDREARTLAQLAHPGIVKYVTHGDEPAVFLAMEWLDGEDLARRLLREPQLKILETLELAKNVCDALAAAHARGIVHRDIKPSNIFLLDGRVDRVKILDFGIAHVAQSTRGVTATGQMLGTLGYMAPEQARSGRDITAAADVFSLGCVLFECFTGRGAFPGEWAMEVVSKILLAESPRLREVRKDLPHVLDELVARMMRKKPDERATLASVAADIASLLTSGVTQLTASQPDTAPEIPAVTGDERRLMSVVLADQRAFGERHDGASTGATVLEATPRIAGIVARYGGQLEVLSGGAPLITLTAMGAATDLAARAARCALAVQRDIPGSRVAVATGRGDPARGAIVGEVFARAEQLLTLSDSKQLRIDAVTAGLLDARFEVSGDSSALVLDGERPHGEVRRLLGKPTPCVGRDRELAMLQDLVRECLDEPLATAVLITANAGAGKSRIRYELTHALEQREHPPEIWVARGDPLSAGASFGMLAQLIRGMAGLSEGELPEVRRQKLLARFGRNLAEASVLSAAEFLGELVGARFPDDKRPSLRTARQDPALMGDQLRRAWDELIAAEAKAGPIVIVLEDLHWGDLPTIRFIDSALRNQRHRPLLVLSLARPEVHEVFPGLFRDRRVNEMRLSDLTPSASRRLVHEVLGPTVDRALVDTLIEKSHGNAFYLEELIRSVAEGNTALPETVLAMAQARLERLEPGARRLLRAASVFGPRFWASGVAALLSAESSDVFTALEDLVQREFVMHYSSARFHGQAEYAFRHILMRDAAYEMLTERDRKSAHKLAGEWLEANGERDAFVLAEHIERSGEREGAIVWYLWAAEQALEGNDLATVIARAERGVECGARGPLLGELQLLQAEACGWSGQHARHAELAESALAVLSPGSAAWCRAAAELAIASRAAGDHGRLRSAAEALSSIEVDEMVGIGHAWAIARTVAELLGAGQAELAQRLLARLSSAIERADQEDVSTLAAIRTWLNAAHSLFSGDPAPIALAAAELQRTFESLGSVRYTAIVALHAAIAMAALGDHASGITWSERAAELARRMGLRAYEARARAWLAVHLAHSGRIELAISSARGAVADAKGNRVAEGDARIALAEALLAAQDEGAAEAEALRVWNDPGFAVEARGRAGNLVARLMLLRDRATEACDAADEALTLLARARPLGDADVRLTRIEALEAMGAKRTADGALADARRQLLERASSIADATLRRRFVEDVAAHKRILSLAQERLTLPSPNP